MEIKFFCHPRFLDDSSFWLSRCFYCMSLFSLSYSSTLVSCPPIPFLSASFLLAFYFFSFDEINHNENSSVPLAPLWFRIIMNRDVSTGPLASPFAHSFACYALLALLAHSAEVICSLARSLTVELLGRWTVQCLNKMPFWTIVRSLFARRARWNACRCLYEYIGKVYYILGHGYKIFQL